MSLLFTEHEKVLPVSKSLSPSMQATLESTENPDDFPSPIGLHPGLDGPGSACIYRDSYSKKPCRLFYRSAEIEVTFAYYCMLACRFVDKSIDG